MKMNKMISFFLAFCIMVSLFPLSLPANAAEKSYTINGKVVTASSGTAVWNCSTYAVQILKQIWTVNTVMATYNNRYNLLNGKNASEREITEAHVKEYIQATPLGSRIRVCASSDTTSNNYDNNSKGHTMVLVEKNDANGTFTVLEAGGGAALSTTYTYKRFADFYRNSKKYLYFFYIADYHSAEKNIGSTTLSSSKLPVGKTSKPSVSVNGQTVTASWTYSGSATKFDVYLVQDPWRWEDIKYQTSVTAPGNSCAFNNVAPGDYRLFTITRPNADTVQSEWTDVTVTASAETTDSSNKGSLPTNFTLSIGKNSYTLGESVAITPSADNATYYAISIWLGAFNTGELLYENYDLPGGTTFTPPREGTYTIRADGKNGNGYISTEKTFSVTAPAKQSATYTVTFDANGGIIGNAFNPKKFETTTVTSGGTYGTFPHCEPDPSGEAWSYWIFDGWYTAREGGIKVTETSSLAVNANHTLYAHWRKDCVTIICDGNGGYVDPSLRTRYFASGTWDTSPFPYASRDSYTLEGWYTEKVGGEKISYVKVGENFELGKTYTLYAHWSKRTSYYVYLSNIFDSITGNPSSGEITVSPGGTYASLPNPTRIGYTFDGWYDSWEDGAQRVTNTTPILKNEDHRLWAHWTKN